MSVFIPLRVGYFVLKKFGHKSVDKLLCVYNRDYFVGVTCQDLTVRGDSILVSTQQISKNCKNNLNMFISKWGCMSSTKIKFSGKGYKLVKQDSCFSLFFNTSHTQWLLLFRTLSLKLTKQKYLFLGKNSAKLGGMINFFMKTRLVNIYTKRGLRCSKQKILKKVGKRNN